jgi:hypothetical protein
MSWRHEIPKLESKFGGVSFFQNMIAELLKRKRPEENDSRPSKRPTAPLSSPSSSINVPAFAASRISLTEVRDESLLSNQDTVTLSGILSMRRDLVSMYQFNFGVLFSHSFII